MIEFNYSKTSETIKSTIASYLESKCNLDSILADLFEACEMSNDADTEWDADRNYVANILSEVSKGKKLDRSGWVTMAERIISHASNTIESDVQRIKQRLRSVHPEYDGHIKYVIWAGMGGSAEIGKVVGGIFESKCNPKIFILDTTDPFALEAIIDEIQGQGTSDIDNLKAALCHTIVIGVSMGMTSEEPVINMKACEDVFQTVGFSDDFDTLGAHFWAMTLANSTVHEFLKVKGWGGQRVAIQLDGDSKSTLSGRNSYNSRVALWHLYFLGGKPAVEEYLEAQIFSEDDRKAGLLMGLFIAAAEADGKSELVFILPKKLQVCEFWLMQQAEESLGKNPEHLLKVSSYRDGYGYGHGNDKRVYVNVVLDGDGEGEGDSHIQMNGCSVATLHLRSQSHNQLSACSTLLHCFVHSILSIGIVWGRDVVGQYSVELYKSYVQKFMLSAMRDGGFGDFNFDQVNTPEVTIAKQRWLSRTGEGEGGAFKDTIEWKRLIEGYGDSGIGQTKLNIGKGNGVTMYYVGESGKKPTELFKMLLSKPIEHEYVEITVYNDCVHRKGGAKYLIEIDECLGGVFRKHLPNTSVHCTEGPRDNHSRLEMSTAGRNTGLIILVTSALEFKKCRLVYPVEYLPMQVLATWQSYLDHGRDAVLLCVPGLSEGEGVSWVPAFCDLLEL